LALYGVGVLKFESYLKRSFYSKVILVLIISKIFEVISSLVSPITIFFFCNIIDIEFLVEYSVKIGFDYAKKLGRKEWVRVRVQPDDKGHLTAYKIHSGGSGILTSLVDADGLLELNEDMEVVDNGQFVDFLPFNEVTR
jgi:hypothetical protein